MGTILYPLPEPPSGSFLNRENMNRAILAFTILLLLSACIPKEESNPGKAVVSVSILPQKYFIERLAGDKVDVNVMVPPGASPATYEPTASQLSSLTRSALYMKIGYLGFEMSWMDKIASVNPSMKVVDLSTGINLLMGAEDEGHSQDHRHGHGGIDPHTWMSARNAAVMAAGMYESLCSLLPGEKEMLTTNLTAMLLEMDSLDQRIAGMLAGMEHRSFMIYHPSLSYFARDYNLRQFPLELEGKTPSPAHLKEMSDLGREQHISTIFVQVEFDQKNAEVLAHEIGAKIVRVNPLDPDWPAQMLYIATLLKASQ
jgi:zinc transport system substrate-binding protein